jgi:hypothetical protein
MMMQLMWCALKISFEYDMHEWMVLVRPGWLFFWVLSTIEFSICVEKKKKKKTFMSGCLPHAHGLHMLRGHSMPSTF